MGIEFYRKTKDGEIVEPNYDEGPEFGCSYNSAYTLLRMLSPDGPPTAQLPEYLEFDPWFLVKACSTARARFFKDACEDPPLGRFIYWLDTLNFLAADAHAANQIVCMS
jgi:hypothetical protein